MGWCSATRIFDDILDAALMYIPPDKQEWFAFKVACTLWEGDWDCEGDSNYYQRFGEMLDSRNPCDPGHRWSDINNVPFDNEDDE